MIILGNESAMTSVSELITEYERRRAEADQIEASAPVAKIYGQVLDELRGLEAGDIPDRVMSTEEAARLLGIGRAAVAKRCAGGELEGAQKTSGARGRWRIPARSVYASRGITPRRRNGYGIGIPKLVEV